MKAKALKNGLTKRVIPSQERAKKSVQLILDTTADLLEEVGIDSFNTNLLAERAGIRVRTIYRYFPNKNAIITELYLDWQKRVMDMTVIMDKIGDPRIDWRDVLEELWSTFIEMTQYERGYSAIRRAVRSTPELIILEEEAMNEATERLITAFTQRGLSLPEQQLRAICRIVIENFPSLSDVIATDGKAYAEEIKKEFIVLYQSYLNNYLD